MFCRSLRLRGDAGLLSDAPGRSLVSRASTHLRFEFVRLDSLPISEEVRLMIERNLAAYLGVTCGTVVLRRLPTRIRFGLTFHVLSLLFGE